MGKNKRRIVLMVTPQTAYNLQRLADMDKTSPGSAVDKLVRDRMMDRDIRLALLGDHEAAKRLTDAGVLVPCWRCGGDAELQEIHTGGKPVYAVSCKKHHCGAYGCAHQTKKNAVAYWNTRAPILSSREMEMLEGVE